jgi:hypothetical protein
MCWYIYIHIETIYEIYVHISHIYIYNVKKYVYITFLDKNCVNNMLVPLNSIITFVSVNVYPI